MLMHAELEKVRYSKKFGRILTVRYREGSQNLPHRRIVVTGKVIADEIDRLIIERINERGPVTIHKADIIIVS